jgi:hypothetical protein
MRESPGEIRIKADRFEPLFDVGACIATAHDTVGERASPLLYFCQEMTAVRSQTSRRSPATSAKCQQTSLVDRYHE